MPFQLGYVSTANSRMLRDDLLGILTVARRINRANKVSGLLLFDGGHFLQVLEGSEAAVRETFKRIAGDARHRDIDVVFEKNVRAPEFADWSMGFQALDGVDWIEFPKAEGEPDNLRTTVERYGQAKDLLLRMHLHGLDPDRELATPA